MPSFSIEQKHGGFITVKSKLGKGSTFSVYLPAKPGAAPAPSPPTADLIEGRVRILVLDDEEQIGVAVGRMLRRLGYSVATSTRGEEAIDIYERALRAGERFAAVILDLTIPGGKGGKETIVDLKRLDPDVTAIVSSGYSTDPIMADFREYGFAGVIAKPYGFSELSTVVHEAISGHS